MRSSGARRAIASVAVASACIFGSAVPASADRLSDKKAEAARVADRIEQLHRDAEKVAEDLNGAQSNLATVTKEVGAVSGKVAEQDAEVVTLQSQLSQFAIRSYVQGSTGGGLMTVFSPEVAGESIQREGYAAIVLGGSSDASDRLKAVLEDTTKLKVSLTTKQKQAQQLTESIKQKQTNLAKAEKDLEKLQSSLDREMVVLVQQAEAAKAEKARQDFLANQRRINEEQTRRGNSGCRSNHREAAQQRWIYRNDDSVTERREQPGAGGDHGETTCGSSPTAFGVGCGRACRERRMEPDRGPLPVRHIEPGRVLRLLGPHHVGLVAGWGVVATNISAAVLLAAQGLDRSAAAR